MWLELLGNFRGWVQAPAPPDVYAALERSVGATGGDPIDIFAVVGRALVCGTDVGVMRELRHWVVATGFGHPKTIACRGFHQLNDAASTTIFIARRFLGPGR